MTSASQGQAHLRPAVKDLHVDRVEYGEDGLRRRHVDGHAQRIGALCDRQRHRLAGAHEAKCGLVAFLREVTAAEERRCSTSIAPITHGPIISVIQCVRRSHYTSTERRTPPRRLNTIPPALTEVRAASPGHRPQAAAAASGAAVAAPPQRCAR